MCAEPVRNVRSDGNAPKKPGPSWLQWVIGGFIAVVLLFGGCCGVGMWRLANGVRDAQRMMGKDLQKMIEEAKAKAEAERRARMVVVPAAQLLEEFQNDPAADRKYRGKYLEIVGVVERGGNDGNGTPFVILHAGDENARIKIECFFDLEDEEDELHIKRLEKGRTITVRGEYDGMVSNLKVRECVLAK
jgi:hypothetical protein